MTMAIGDSGMAVAGDGTFHDPCVDRLGSEEYTSSTGDLKRNIARSIVDGDPSSASPTPISAGPGRADIVQRKDA